MGATRHLVLASASPARLALLRAAGFDPQAIPSEVDEDGVDNLSAAEATLTLAERKAGAVAERLEAQSGALVLGCDSLLSMNGSVRGKPATVDEARSWWQSQRGGRGILVTGHCVIDTSTGRAAGGVAQTDVLFGSPSDDEIEAYLATGEPLQVAGAATIDGYGAPFIDGVNGDHGTVLGLSLPLLRRLLSELGIAITDLWTKP